MAKTRYIVLFRGVGGATQLPVKQLRQVLGDAGFEDVATYINSGNAVLTSGDAEAKVTEKVAQAVRTHMGFEKAVMVRSLDHWQAMIDGNPYFDDAEAAPTTVHVFTMEHAVNAEAQQVLAAKATGTERFWVEGRTLYLHTPDGMGRSLFAPKIEPTLKTAMTARNWRSMLALAKLARGD
ncbi:hypothetical protein NA8A_03915 [Nitratireductor indicus C115]|uniref:DUF1697 domain-containing protein n=1 Tax=Nitratireductor indicus C115 TaxID=1231190 RepID=K2NXD2_9HYPH|nr:DUF1697 domain-containing protein [Nitratireductor indicus]EKF43925.1 hypothetical protein NA8A_03915 [Nitratireductor indicus C115]SFQ14116.1 Uncharacterized conserved protein, DUF1697 family [Nitratireductor indicus]